VGTTSSTSSSSISPGKLRRLDGNGHGEPVPPDRHARRRVAVELAEVLGEIDGAGGGGSRGVADVRDVDEGVVLVRGEHPVHVVAVRVVGADLGAGHLAAAEAGAGPGRPRVGHEHLDRVAVAAGDLAVGLELELERGVRVGSEEPRVGRVRAAERHGRTRHLGPGVVDPEELAVRLVPDAPAAGAVQTDDGHGGDALIDAGVRHHAVLVTAAVLVASARRQQREQTDDGPRPSALHVDESPFGKGRPEGNGGMGPLLPTSR
jgi:hypothetical protein